MESPTIISEKKTPIDSTAAEAVKVASMPAPAPRCDGGRLFITPAVFGDVKSPCPMPLTNRISANHQYGKLTGSAIRSPKLNAAISIPPVANGRAPKRSDR